jgi:uncharacterized membrane protein
MLAMAEQGRLRRLLSTRVWAAVALFLTLVATAWAVSPQVQSGVTWLVNQVQSTGALINENNSVAAPLQNRDESLRSLLSLAPGSVTPDVTQDDYSATEYVAREILSFSAKGTDASAALSALAAAQNADGGFGSSAGYPSDALDSAWALAALVKQSGIYSSQINVLKTYLFGQMWADGGLGSSTDRAAMEASSLMLMGLEATAVDLPTTNAMQQLSAWLARQQGADGSWGTDLYLTGYALAALAPLSADTTMQQTATAYLLGKQGSNGSWNDDPFLTAVILRALAQSTTAPSTNNAIVGQVISAGSGQPLSGVAVAVSGSTVNGATDATGHFSLQNVPVGSHVVSFALSGFQGTTLTTSVPLIGATSLGAISLAPSAGVGVLSGIVVDGSTQHPIAAATITVAGSSPQTAQSDTTGHFQISNLPAGSISLSIAAAGYVTASAVTSISSGTTTLYQPTLYPQGSTAGTGSSVITGQVVAQGSNQPLANVQVLVNQTALTTTDSNGNLNLNLSSGTYTVGFLLAGYGLSTEQITVNGGDTEALGIIYLTPQLNASTVFGTVTDAATKKPIAGAIVQLTGGSSVTADSSGNYSLTNLSGLQLSLHTSAAGYDSQLLQLQLTQPAIINQNFALAAQSGQGVSIAPLTVNPNPVSLNTPVTIGATFQNAGSDQATLTASLQIINAQGKVIATAPAFASPTAALPLGTFSILPGSSQAISFKWNSGSFPPGQYTLLAMASLPGTSSKTSSLGTVVAQGNGSLSIAPQASIMGSVTATPPVQQLGNTSPVRVSAMLQSVGNIASGVHTITAQITDQNNTQVASLQASLASLPVKQLASLDFGSWTPATSGSYTINMTNDDGTALASTPVYIGAAATGVFTANPSTVGTGTQTVHGQVSLQGIGTVTGTLTDPLAVLIKSALQPAVKYNDDKASAWVSSNFCVGCHIGSQALVGGELNNALVPRNAAERNAILNGMNYEQHINSYPSTEGAISLNAGYYQQFSPLQTNLNAWGLNAWQNVPDVIDQLVPASGFIVNQQGSNGGWHISNENERSGWWYDDYAINALATYNLNKISQTLANNPALAITHRSLTTYGPGTEMPTFTYGHINPSLYAMDEDGNSYIFDAYAGVLLMPASGEPQVLVPISVIQAAAPNKACVGLAVRNKQIYVGTESNIQIYDLATGAPVVTYPGPTVHNMKSMSVARDGSIWVVGNYQGSFVYQLVNGTYTVRDAVNINIQNGYEDAIALPSGVFYLKTSSSSLLAVGESPWVPPGVNISLPSDIDSMSVDNAGNLLVSTHSYLIRVNPNNTLTYLFEDDQDTVRGAGQLADGSYIVFRGDEAAGHLIQVQEKVPYSQSDITGFVASYTDSLAKDWSYWQNNLPVTSGPTMDTDNLHFAFTLIGLGNMADHFDHAGQPAQAAQARALMVPLVDKLRSTQLTSTDPKINGSWGHYNVVDPNNLVLSQSDPMVTAIIGYSLQYTTVSGQDPMLRNAVQYELSNQNSDGSWHTYMLSQTNIAATTWVSIFMPIALNKIVGINSDLYLTVPATANLANPTLAVADSTANIDGSTQYHWSFANLQQSGQALDFDLTLSNLLPNEVRPAVSEAHLSFGNSFTGTTVNEALNIPTITASAGLGLLVSTDQGSYGANAPVAITANVNNSGAGAASGSVHLVVFAADGTLVADLGNQTFNGLAPSAQDALTASWNTATLLPNSYYVQATLLDANGNPVNTQRSNFTIVSSSATGTLVGAGVTTSKASYGPLDTVNVDDRITNLTSNNLVGNLTLHTTITDPSGAVFWTMPATTLQQLTPGSLKDFTASIPVNNALPGTYTVNLVVTDSSGATQATASNTFTVQSTATTGQGLSGTLALSAASLSGHNLISGDSLTLSATVSNAGNAAISGLPVTTTLLDPVSNTPVTQWADTLSLPLGGHATLSHQWPSSGGYGKSYVIVVNSSLNGTALAQGVITLVKPLLTLGVSADKAAYDINSSARLATVLTSATPIPLAGLSLSKQILRSDGTVLWQATVPGIALAANGSLNPPVDTVALGITVAGTYAVQENVLDVSGSVLAQASASFQVNSTASNGVGLSGAINSLAGITAGSTVNLGFTVTNAGNAGLLNLPAQVIISNTTTNAPVATLPTTLASLAMGGNAPGQVSWNSSGTPSSTALQATLQVQVGTGWITLAQQAFSLNKPLVTSALSGVVGTGYVYDAPVSVSASVQNQSTVAINAASLVWTLTRPDGTVLNTSTITPAPTLAAGSTTPEAYSYTFTNATPGNYTLTLVITGNGETQLSSTSTTLIVQSTAQTGAGVTGTLGSLASITAGSTANVGFTITNVGNASLGNLPVQILITNTSNGGSAPVTTLSTTLAAVANNGTGSSGQVSWNTSGITSATPLQATLQVQVGSGWKTLAQQSVTLLKPVVVTTIGGVASTGYAYNGSLSASASIQNQSTVAINPATIVWTLSNPAGTVLDTRTISPAPTLAAGSTTSAAYNYSFSNAAPGNYSLRISVAGNGESLSTPPAVTVIVQSSAQTGAGLSASLSATPTAPNIGQTVVLGESLSNAGNAALTNLPLTLTLSQGTTVVQSFTDTVTSLAAGAVNQSLAHNWVPATAGTYTEKLTATIGSTVLTLATGTLTVAQTPVKISVTPAAGSHGRVLVYLSCKPGEREGQGNPNNPNNTCLTQRQATLASYFGSLGVSYSVVTDDDAFTLALRRGRYNSYWLLGSITPVEDDLVDELREAVNRGDSLVLDSGPQGNSNYALYHIAGVSYQGHLSFGSNSLGFTAPVYSDLVGTSLSSASGWTWFSVYSGSVAAYWNGSQNPHGDNDHEPGNSDPSGWNQCGWNYGSNNGNSGSGWNNGSNGGWSNGSWSHGSSTQYPAIVSGQYGQGRTLALAFDLMASLQAVSTTSTPVNSGWSKLLADSLGYSTPAALSRALVPGEAYSASFPVQNQGQTVNLYANLVQPTGGSYLGANLTGTAQSNGSEQFSLSLASSQTLNLITDQLAPASSGSYNLTLSAQTNATPPTSLGSFVYSLSVGATQASRQSTVNSEINAIPLTLGNVLLLNAAKSYYALGQAALGRSDYGSAIDALADAGEALSQISGIQASTARADLDLLLKLVESRWQPPVKPGNGH